MVGILIVLVLLALGLLNARAFFSAKHEKLKQGIDAIAPYESYIGLAGIVFGLIGILNMLSVLSYIGHAPLYFLIGFIGAVLTLLLGILSAANMIKTQVISGNANLVAKLDQVVGKLAPHQTNMGIAGTGIALFYLILIVVN